MARRTRRSTLLLSLLVLTGASVGASQAEAQGFEYAAPGTRSLGRGGAFMARADDPMALGYNPAALAFLPGYQLSLGSHVAFYDACVERSGTYDDSDVSGNAALDSRYGFPESGTADNWVNQPFPRVCRETIPGPSPQLVFSGHPLPELGFAVGLLAPAAVGSGAWGDGQGSVDVDGTLLPSPTRYQLVSQNLLLFHPSIGVGFSPFKELAIGVTLQWGMALVDYAVHTSSGFGPEDPAEDVRTELSVQDWFVPAIIASVHIVPIDELDIVVMARISDSINAEGDLRLTTGVNGTGMPGSLDPAETLIQGTQLSAGQPWQFGLSARYAERIHRRYRDPEEASRVNGRVEDRMQNEVWDLELDVVYSLNRQVTDFVVTQPAGASAQVCEANASPEACDGTSFDATLPSQLSLPHGWQDQLSVRVGADWNVVPGAIALRLGSHFVTNGLNDSFAIADFLPGMRLGLHLGATFRFDRFDVSIAYAHIFQFDHTVRASDANYRLIAATGSEGQCTGPDGAAYDRDQPTSNRGCYPQGAGAVANAGTYQAEFNVISLSGRYHFD
ncbi:MAG: OmpP1/FadL family transporter [Sandaracinaceae bacterium]